MSSYHPEIELQSPTLSISLYPEKGLRLESMNISRRGGKPKSKHAILVEFRVAPIEDLAPSPLKISIPWKKGDPSKVEIQVVEVYEIEQEAMIFDLKKKTIHTRKAQNMPESKENGKASLPKNLSNSRGLTPKGGLKPKDVSGHKKPILDDD